MSWKEWDQGEVVEAGDLQEYIQDQVVQNYADSAARSTALGTAVAEGMVSYLQDSNSVEVYDGSAWVAVGNDLSSGTAGYTALSNGTAGLSYQPVSHNYIINGGFDIWQRGTSGTATNDYVSVDRWRTFKTTELNQSTDVPDDSFQYSLEIVSDDSRNFMGAETRLESEQVYLFAGKEVTLSAWVKVDSASLATSPRILLNTADAKNDFSSTTTEDNIILDNIGVVANTWTRVSTSVTLSSSAANGIEIVAHSSGTTGSTGATLKITGVQLEAGSIATPFKRNANSIQGELAACQRYYYQSGTSTSDLTILMRVNNIGTSSKNLTVQIPFPVRMRANPTLVAWGDISDGASKAFDTVVSQKQDGGWAIMTAVPAGGHVDLNYVSADAEL